MTLELPIIPKPGEVFLAVNLSAVGNMTVAETLKLLAEMGYNPRKRSAIYHMVTCRSMPECSTSR